MEKGTLNEDDDNDMHDIKVHAFDSIKTNSRALELYM